MLFPQFVIHLILFFTDESLYKTNGHKSVTPGTIINLNQKDEPAAATSVFTTLKKQNHIAMVAPAIRYK
jgi:hypothetical protein